MTAAELLALRHRAKLTQAQAAARCDRSARQWRKYETGIAPIPDSLVPWLRLQLGTGDKPTKGTKTRYKLG